MPLYYNFWKPLTVMYFLYMKMYMKMYVHCRRKIIERKNSHSYVYSLFMGIAVRSQVHIPFKPELFLFLSQQSGCVLDICENLSSLDTLQWFDLVLKIFALKSVAHSLHGFLGRPKNNCT